MARTRMLIAHYTLNKHIPLTDKQYEFAKLMGYEGENSFEIGAICSSRDHANELLKREGIEGVRFTQTNTIRSNELLNDEDWASMCRVGCTYNSDYDGSIVVFIPVRYCGRKRKIAVDIAKMHEGTLPELIPGEEVVKRYTSPVTGATTFKGPYMYMGTYKKNGRDTAQCLSYGKKDELKLNEFSPDTLVPTFKRCFAKGFLNDLAVLLGKTQSRIHRPDKKY